MLPVETNINELSNKLKLSVGKFIDFKKTFYKFNRQKMMQKVSITD